MSEIKYRKPFVAVMFAFAVSALSPIAAYPVDTIAHTSTGNVTWTFPDGATLSQEGFVDYLEINKAGIVQTLEFGSTNAVIVSVLAELPVGIQGEIAGCTVQRHNDKNDETFYAFAYSNGDGTFSLGYDTTTNKVTSGNVSDWTSMHLWTFAFAAQVGARLYCDGTEIARSDDIKWTPSAVEGKVTFCDDPRGGYAINGAKIYAVDTDFGIGNAIFSSVIDTEPILRISEIMPKPTDAQSHGALEGMDVNGLESGWVELENPSYKWADLKDYRFMRVNRGKKTDPGALGNFPSRLVPPRSRTVFYTSERYSNSKDKDVSAFSDGTFDGKPKIFEDYGGILVWGDKVNPKKSPYVRLYYMPDEATTNVVNTVVIPSDIPEGCSIIVGDAAESEGTRRWLCETPTRGKVNVSTDGLKRLGPNVGPLYEISTQKKTDVASEFALPVPPAVPGKDYSITLPINPVMNPDGTFTPRDPDKITSIMIVYRKDLDDSTLTTNKVSMTKKTDKKAWGDQYTATIPSSYFPERGHLIQWKVLITDGEGVEWTSPSFNNPDDGYEWYGTIVEPSADQMSATLPTWHLFALEPHLTQMDKDKDDQDMDLVPNYARIAIYDSSTSNYYDYVRIDLRGNTSASFTKKGHGLRFAKAHPLTMRDIVSGEDIEEIRKTSLISEFADPSFMRQMIAFWLWRRMGNLVPFDFPVRCNLNGEFYQLAFNSERFTDELIEDVYGLDKFGWSWKNVGTLKSGSGTTAGGIEKKTPDDEDESNVTVLQNELRSKITAAQNVSGTSSAAKSSTETDQTGLDNADLTEFVVRKFNLPAWINYLASAKITQEMDDVWANICVYYDNAAMTNGVRGTDTWMPLGYDFNLSFGQWYYGDVYKANENTNGPRFGLMSNQDWFKSHPFYGGNRVRCWKQAEMTGTCNYGNDAFEAVWQSAKFRRLYLRRLRTLMDQELKAPGTDESEVPFMVKMREMAELMRADSELDQAKWPNNDSDSAIDVWGNSCRPADIDAGIQDIWNNYVVPRRKHLYVTHSINNTSRNVGYGSNLIAGIPDAQSPISELAPKISVANMTVLGETAADELDLDSQFCSMEVIEIHNGNDEVVDMSGWTLAFSVDFTMPPGTVCDANDSIYVVADRRAYINAMGDITDQVIVGNAKFNEDGRIAIYAADGTLVYARVLGVENSCEGIEFEAKNQEAADTVAAAATIVLTDEDVESGLDISCLMVVAIPVEGTKGRYRASVTVNPDSVAAPELAPGSSGSSVDVDEDGDGGRTVSITISNAVKGLWYGYETSDDLSADGFEEDAPSFNRAAANGPVTVSGSKRTSPTGFFRVKVLPFSPALP